MFKTKKSKWLTGLAALACVCCVGGVSAQYDAASSDLSRVSAETVAATAETPAVYIESKNVAYSESLYLLFAVSYEGFDRAENDIMMLFWDKEQTDYTVANGTGVTTQYVETINGKDCKIFYSRGIAAKEMAESIYCRAYAEVDGEIYYSDVEKYSVVDYVYEMREGSLTANQEAAFTAMLDYGAAAQNLFAYNTDRLANATFYTVSVANGTLEDGTTMGRYVANSTVTMTAEATKGDAPFICWKNGNGEVVSEETTLTVTVSGNQMYSAQYDEPLAEVNLPAIQSIVMTDATYSINLGAYANDTIKSITMGDYDLGTNPAALNISDALKADTMNHGRQTIVINAINATLGEYLLNVPVTLVTKTIATAEDFRTIQPTQEHPSIYGYYVQTADFSDTTLGTNWNDWAATTGFFGTYDGAGHYIHTAANKSCGIFTLLRGATIKNLTVKDGWLSGGTALLARAAYGATLENITIEWLSGNVNAASAKDGNTWLFAAEFSGCTVRNLTTNVPNSGGVWHGTIFGTKFYNNTFDNVVINGTYGEIGYCPDLTANGGPAEKTYKTLEDVDAPTVTKVVFEQQVIDMSLKNVQGIDLGVYENATIVDIVASNGAVINGLAAEFLPTDKANHGELTLTVTVLNENDETVDLIIPVILATKTISTMQELYDVVKMKSGVAVDGCYLLTADVSDTEEGFTVGSPSSYEWQTGTSGFCGTLIGAAKTDGSKYTVSFGGGRLNHGLFTTIRNATVKNIKFVNTAHDDGWNNSVIGYTAFNTTFEDVDFEIISTKVSTGYGVLVGSNMGGCTWKNVTVKSAQAHGMLFKVINDGNNVDTFENFTVEVLSLDKFSNTVADAPAGVTVVQTQS